MKISAHFAIALATVLSSSAVVAADGNAPATQSTTAEAPKKEKKTCVREASTGSIMVKRVCYTKAQAEAMRAETEKSLDDLNRGSAAGAGSN